MCLISTRFDNGFTVQIIPCNSVTCRLRPSPVGAGRRRDRRLRALVAFKRDISPRGSAVTDSHRDVVGGESIVARIQFNFGLGTNQHSVRSTGVFTPRCYSDVVVKLSTVPTLHVVVRGPGSLVSEGLSGLFGNNGGTGAQHRPSVHSLFETHNDTGVRILRKVVGTAVGNSAL